MHTSGTRIIALGIGVVLMLLGGCSPHHNVPADSQENANSQPNTTHSGSADSTDSKSRMDNGSGKHDACAASNLKIQQVGADAGAGSIHEQISFTNVGANSCVLTGRPGVQRLSLHDQPLPPHISPEKGAEPLILAPKQSAYVTVGLNNLASDGSPYVPSQCQAVALTALHFTLAGNGESLDLSQKGYGCSTGIDKLQIDSFSLSQ